MAQNAILIALLFVACARSPASSAPPDEAIRADPVVEAATIAKPAPPPPPPEKLAGEPLAEIPVAGFKDAWVSVPVGATTRRPVMVAAHGTGDRPDWQCREMRNLLGDRAFVLCPRGAVSAAFSTPGDTRYQFNGAAALAEEIAAGLAALNARYAKFIDDGPMLYEGFSFGASAAVGLVAREASRYPRVIMTEGGHDGWNAISAKQFVANGGKRVLFACGQRGCEYGAKQAAATLAKAGAEAKVVLGEGEGHGYGGNVARRIREELAWLVAGDARWLDPGESR